LAEHAFKTLSGTNLSIATYLAGGLQRGRGKKAVTEPVTVLIVEDDQLIQGMVEEALSDGGFKSVITWSGEEAVALLQTNESIYRAIVTDINLLGTIDGWEVARCAGEIDPALPVIYMTVFRRGIRTPLSG
jgi:CheY-like chemotaxis protein